MKTTMALLIVTIVLAACKEPHGRALITCTNPAKPVAVCDQNLVCECRESEVLKGMVGPAGKIE